MQLLKITTTPIKYRIESEDASFTVSQSDSNENIYDNFNIPVVQTSEMRNNSEKLKEQTNFNPNTSGIRREDRSFSMSGGTVENNEYDVKYRYGQKNAVSENKPYISGGVVQRRAAVSIDTAINNIESIIPDKSWEPERKISDTVNSSPEKKVTFNPAKTKMVVEEMADVKIEYIGGFNYFPKSSDPDYVEPEDD